MKLLHTGDLHLGKSLHESSLIEDQKTMLDQLLEALKGDDYAALVIAGDVYDRTIPSAEAVELFSSFLARTRSECPRIEVCIIPGNHDSPQRLSFANRILRERGIHIASTPKESFTPIITDKNDEKLALFLLPFLAHGSLSVERKVEIPAKRKKASTRPGELDFFAPEPDAAEASGNEEPLLVSQAALGKAGRGH